MPAIHGKHSIFIIYERLAVVQGEQKIKFLCTGGDAVSGSAAPEQRHEQRRSEGGAEASPGIGDHVEDEVLRIEGERDRDAGNREDGKAADPDQLMLFGIFADERAVKVLRES